MHPMVVLSCTIKEGSVVFLMKPSKPCKLGQTSEHHYSFDTYKGVTSKGPVSGVAGAVVPLSLTIDLSKAGNLAMCSLQPFTVYTTLLAKPTTSIGDLVDAYLKAQPVEEDK